MLRVEGVVARYGKIEALRGVDIHVDSGEIVTLIGANGAGKSTLLMTICGNPRAAAGRILFEERDIAGMATHDIVRLGSCRCRKAGACSPASRCSRTFNSAPHHRARIVRSGSGTRFRSVSDPARAAGQRPVRSPAANRDAGRSRGR